MLQSLYTIPWRESTCSDQSVECSRQFYDPAVCDCADDSPTHCAVQEALLQNYPWLAYTVFSNAAISVFIPVYWVSKNILKIYIPNIIFLNTMSIINLCRIDISIKIEGIELSTLISHSNLQYLYQLIKIFTRLRWGRTYFLFFFY